MKKILIAGGIIVLVATVAVVGFRQHRTFAVQHERVGGESASVSPQVPFDLAFCDDTLAEGAGTLCAVKPSKTDSRILDVSPPTGEAGDANLGFGYHVLAVPDDLANAKGVWIHLTGSYGRPYNQNRDAYESAVWLNELMEEGYIVIQLAYDNRFSVNGDLCGRRNEGYNRDNCAGEVREIALTGQGVSPYRATDEYNTIDYRLEKLLSYLEEHNVTLAGIDAANIDWGVLRVSGHSQGANQAYYIAKKRPVAFACILAGGYDSPDSVNPGRLPIADWFTSGSSATPLSRIGAFLTTTDDGYNAFYTGLTRAVGLPQSQIVVSDKKQYFDRDGNELNGHAATVKDTSLKDLRAAACFK